MRRIPRRNLPILPYEAEEDDEDERMASDAGRRRGGGRLGVFVARRGRPGERRVAAPGEGQNQEENRDDEVGREGHGCVRRSRRRLDFFAFCRNGVSLYYPRGVRLVAAAA